MRRPAFAVILACCATFSAVLPASARAQGVPTAPSAAALPAAAFGTVPAIDTVTLSLDGKLLASAYVGDQVSIAILDLVARKPRHRIAFDQTMKLRSMGFVDDTTLRVPLIVRWPGHVTPGVTNEMAHVTDLFTTLATLAGADVPQDRAIDGLNLLPFLTGQAERSPREGFPYYIKEQLRSILSQIKPTDEVIVQPATLVPFAIEAQLTVFAGPDQALLLQTALDSLNAHLAAARKLGRERREVLLADAVIMHVARGDEAVIGRNGRISGLRVRLADEVHILIEQVRI